jgi:hypothetical protein
LKLKCSSNWALLLRYIVASATPTVIVAGTAGIRRSNLGHSGCMLRPPLLVFEGWMQLQMSLLRSSAIQETVIKRPHLRFPSIDNVSATRTTTHK